MNTLGVLIGASLALTSAAAADVVGYYTDFNEGTTAPEAGIVANGHTPVHITDIASFDLSTIDCLIINNANNGAYSPGLMGRIPALDAWVAAGGRLMVHDRWVNNGGLSGNPILVGPGAGIQVSRDFGNDADIDILISTLVDNGPFGVLHNDSLDGGTSSSHGYAVRDTLPEDGSVPLLNRGGAPAEIVSFVYEHGAGAVFYSTIPLDYYLEGFGGDPPTSAMVNIYYPNAIAYLKTVGGGGECYPDCDESGALNLFDFLCFVGAFNAGEGYADCNNSGDLNLFDFLCFVQAFNEGCD